MPYADKRYDLKEYNPPPNELGFLGGLGKRTGTTRSKAHVQRPTMNQILFKMRTANRILVSFSEDPIMAHSYTRKQMEKSPKPGRKATKKDLNLKISQIQIADNIIKMSKGFSGDSTTSETERLEPEVKVETSSEKRKPKSFSLGAMKKISIVSAMKSNEPQKKEEEPQTFREWAMAEREKRHQALQQVSYQQIKQEREANEIFPKVKKPPKVFIAEKSHKKKANLLPGSEHLGGFLYGGFTEVAGPDETMTSQTKFNVPLSMFSRAKIESKVRAMCKKKIQSARLEYMKIMPQIPSDSEDSEEDVFEDIKGLSFVRTPYFLMPAVKHTKVKRVERLKSKHLKGNRLKRINMLLFDRKLSAEKHKLRYGASNEGNLTSERSDDESKDGEDGEVIENSKHEKSKSSTLLPSIESRPIEKTFDSEYKQRYHEFLHDKFLDKLEQYNEKLNQKLSSFDEFHENTSSPMSGMTAKTLFDRKSFRDYSIETMSSNVPCVITPDIQKDPAFKKINRKIRKNMKFSRSDNRTGGFYFDPFLIEKVHNPEKGMKIMKNYTSLMRTPSNIRKRLQTNAPTFEEERCGTKKTGSFYHRLATEWDPYYINEIRHRPKVQKFCVKSDIIKIREMVRKKFLLYFMREDLITLFANQEIENEMINKTTKFIKVR